MHRAPAEGVDTIVACATAPGRGAVAIVRVSGPRVPQIAATLLGTLPPARQATLTPVRDVDGAALDEVLALYFPAPHSYTGEHVLELQGHGSAVLSEALVERCVALGARRAQPGEFTQRAFLNDKLDLAQAEAVADLIDAGSRAAARAALRSLQGEFSARVNELVEALIQLRAWLEAAIDFPEEEIDFLAAPEVATRLADVRARLEHIERGAQQGKVLTEGAVLVIAGRPNAGKSTLMNALAGYDAAIVTPIAGTTRDVLRERIQIDGLPLTLIDTAGLRDDASSHDPIEIEGMRRARSELVRADHVLFVIDGASDPLGRAFEEERDSLPQDVPVTRVFNKQDLAAARGEIEEPSAALWISAAQGLGLDALRAYLKQVLGWAGESAGSFSARARHLDALTRARAHFDAAVGLLQRKQGELVAEELRQAQQALNEITGVFTSDDLLGRIFGSFCIGK
ncbi:MAG: tRNA uridine-5-carboxymethylaminomethyl(34) synthesis GTPase MnmE [Steroidobacteraceae bacterium]